MLHQDLIRDTQSLIQADEASKVSEFVGYSDTPHAIHADDRASYREAQAKEGWAKCPAWFKANGVV